MRYRVAARTTTASAKCNGSATSIIKIDDRPTPNAEALQDVLGNYKVGDEVRVTFARDGREQTATLRLQAPQP